MDETKIPAHDPSIHPWPAWEHWQHFGTLTCGTAAEKLNKILENSKKRPEKVPGIPEGLDPQLWKTALGMAFDLAMDEQDCYDLLDLAGKGWAWGSQAALRKLLGSGSTIASENLQEAIGRWEFKGSKILAQQITARAV